MNKPASSQTLTVGIIGDGFMQPSFFEKAFTARMPGRALRKGK